ncbi:Fur family transcriptional regulator [Celerinatantimonas diazotrophica]|uniref:Ferric uptake regulation protein n=1 Tax=Celerinatantimonas diazotrophica TaxID=412034 RepID=A0A4R1J8M4_9GAMM|nr:Fur family transcriptional regulator [Celerinatantimonas diazotrophica]TCK46942.1 Fur family zinc uptake regulator [Celerinatantimonas diazotrophica]CAG9295710.1 Zinc uptake regulation protein [Celerinatantimonas diazotrophica]
MQQPLAYLVQSAERYCEQNRQRLTPNRRDVLAILVDSHMPMSAYDILDAMRSKQPSVKPPTIYRALKFLQDAKLVHSIESTNQFLVCSHLEHPHQPQLLVCQVCGRVEEIPLSEHMQAHLNESAKEHGFHLIHHAIELHGICQNCQ